MAKSSRSKAKRNAEASPSWRSIAQNGKLRSTSAAAQRRKLLRGLRMTALALGILLLGAGVGYGVYFSGSHLEVFNPARDATPLREMDFASDGVLDPAWMVECFPLPRGTPAMEFDVRALKEQLEAVGQIREATVSIQLPETLRVRVQEHKPLLRARVRTPDGVLRQVLVAADGTVYEPERYPREALRHLPGLTGVRFQWTGEQFRPVEAVRTLAPLLAQARAEFPELYRTWQWISLEGMVSEGSAPHALITVKSREADRIVFAPRVFHRQLSKLHEVVSLARERNLAGFRKIDLSFSDQAIVQFRES